MQLGSKKLRTSGNRYFAKKKIGQNKKVIVHIQIQKLKVHFLNIK
jgi:hypothetical protein